MGWNQTSINLKGPKGDSGATVGAVEYDEAQSLTDPQKQQARNNIGLGNVDDSRDSWKWVHAAEILSNGKKINGVVFDNSQDITISTPESWLPKAWHNIMAFGTHLGWPLFEQRTGASTWAEATLDKVVFDGVDQTFAIPIPMGGSLTAARWTWHSDNLEWCSAEHLVVTVNDSGADRTIKYNLQNSDDGITWTDFASSVTTNQKSFQLDLPTNWKWSQWKWMRLIAERTSGTGDLLITHLKFMTTRVGFQGAGLEVETPYVWDFDRNIRFKGNVQTDWQGAQPDSLTRKDYVDQQISAVPYTTTLFGEGDLNNLPLGWMLCVESDSLTNLPPNPTGITLTWMVNTVAIPVNISDVNEDGIDDYITYRSQWAFTPTETKLFATRLGSPTDLEGNVSWSEWSVTDFSLIDAPPPLAARGPTTMDGLAVYAGNIDDAPIGRVIFLDPTGTIIGANLKQDVIITVSGDVNGTPFKYQQALSIDNNWQAARYWNEGTGWSPWILCEFGPVTWSAVTNKPSTFPPESHTHTPAEVGLSNVNNTADVVKNVLSASKLTTARKINGVAFDGSADITTGLPSSTTAQFNAALSDNDFATLAGAETLTNKILTGPKTDMILDLNGNRVVFVNSVPSAVNSLAVATTAAGGGSVTVSAMGGDTNVDLKLQSSGTGIIKANNIQVADISSSQSLTNKTLINPKIGTIADTNGAVVLNLPTVPNLANYLSIYGGAAGVPVTLTPQGEPNVGLNLQSAGSSPIRVNGNVVADISSAQVFSNKTLTDPKISSTLLDSNGVAAVAIPANASAVNYLRANNSASGAAVSLEAGGSDANISLSLNAKGSGTVQANGKELVDTTTSQTVANKYLVNCKANSILDSSGYASLSFPAGGAVSNYFQLSNSPTNNPVTLAAVGGDANIPIQINAKGSSSVYVNGGQVVTGNTSAGAAMKTWMGPAASLPGTGVVNTLYVTY